MVTRPAAASSLLTRQPNVWLTLLVRIIANRYQGLHLALFRSASGRPAEGDKE